MEFEISLIYLMQNTELENSHYDFMDRNVGTKLSYRL
jgi:hypothetical protein